MVFALDARDIRMTESYIYAFQIGDNGPIKIGVSTKPDRRFKTLEANLPWPLTKLFIVPGSLLNESWVHTRITKHRIRGEWFEDCEEVLQLIARIADPSWQWPEAKKATPKRTPRALNSIGVEMQTLVKAALGAALPGETISKQLDRATALLGLENKKWLTRAAWYGEASCWSAFIADDFRARCRAAMMRKAA